jgi:hypothetical protein
LERVVHGSGVSFSYRDGSMTTVDSETEPEEAGGIAEGSLRVGRAVMLEMLG